MQLNIPKLSRRNAILLYLSVILLLNFLPVLLYPLVSYMQDTGHGALPILYYLFQLFDCLLPFVGIGCALVLMQRSRLRNGLFPLILLAGAKMLASFVGTFLNESTTLWIYNLFSSLLQGFLYALLYFALSLLLYLLFFRKDRDSLPALRSFQNPFFTANLLLSVFFLILQTVTTAYNVVVFIEENYYGLLSFIPTDEIVSMVLDFVMVLLYSVLSYFVMYFAERFAFESIASEAPSRR